MPRYQQGTLGGRRLSAALKYRPEIDGLRAVAVLAVVLFHAKIGPFSGGYVGVDIFFVISGFLITSIVAREIANGTFSIAEFYERRIRRIFPALFVVIVVSFVIGWFVLTPRDYRDFAKSAINAAVFVSNIGFNRTAGYFAPAAESQPLLHTWSLSVEEQFYLVAPLALIGLSRLSARGRMAVLAVLGLASLAWAEWGVRNEWSSAFYLVQSRAWELMIGAAVALGIVQAPKTRGAVEVLGLAGLAMIAVAIFGYTPTTPFPGISALLPCVGAALVILCASSPSTIAQRLLSARPMVGVGKISYSLYLWHWPLLAFAVYAWGEDLGQSERLALIATSIVLSILSWRYVEQPARARAGAIGQRRYVFAAGAASIVACIVGAQAIVRTNGAVWRLSPEAQAFAAETNVKLREVDVCSVSNQNGPQSVQDCRIGASNGKSADFVLWGDSHALAVARTLSDAAKRAGRQGVYVGTGGCPPLLDLDSVAPRAFATCLAGAAEVMALLNDAGIKDVIIFARWGLYAEGTGGANETNVHVRRFVEADQAANRAAFAQALRHTVDALASAGRNVTLFGPVPELPYNLPSAVIRDLMRGHNVLRQDDAYAQPRVAFDERQRTVKAVLGELATHPRIRVFYPDQALCDAMSCKALEQSAALYIDDDHLSAAGAAKLIPMFEAALSPSAPPR